MSLPIHRKYRPSDFEEMYGNRTLVESLITLMDDKVKPTTYLLRGPSGCGKTTLARIMSVYLGCKKPKEYNISDTRGIDAARKIIEKVFYHTFDVSRVIILNEVHMATKEFQNAMLELLEEPPPNTYFILCTTEPEKLLETVLGRCTQFKVSRLNRPDMTSLVKDVIDAEEAEVKTKVIASIVKNAEGSPRQALTMLAKVINMDDEDIDEVIDEVRNEKATIIELCRALNKNAKWNVIASILKELDAEPEMVRYRILKYFTSTLLDDGEARTAFILECFRESYIYSKKAGLVLSCYQATELTE